LESGTVARFGFDEPAGAVMRDRDMMVGFWVERLAGLRLAPLLRASLLAVEGQGPPREFYSRQTLAKTTCEGNALGLHRLPRSGRGHAVSPLRSFW
jgi:hypothetical protein